MTFQEISLSNPVFRSFVFWSTILLVKMLAMAFLTNIHRFTKKTFANPEDEKSTKGAQSKLGDPDVERVRRAHLNDLENILAFIIVAFFYVLTSPHASVAINLIRLAAISRLVHTFVYAIVPTQPSRAISWFVCYAVTIFMATQVLFAFA